ncbi:DUF5958 family protein [Nonomuraea sp. KM90]|uniref:DUF5958 family protein n=1 Tax=Nonomuraea sp. KM90 TaxID=3457428 RepID=UPI003FCDB567
MHGGGHDQRSSCDPQRARPGAESTRDRHRLVQLPEPRRTEGQVLRELSNYCIQAHPSQEETAESIRRAGLRPTHTPAMLITRPGLPRQLNKIIHLPQAERIKSFRLLIALLGTADMRRRLQDCINGCNHPWHHL